MHWYVYCVMLGEFVCWLYRYGFRELIERGCADILQPDITWVGGITEVGVSYSQTTKNLSIANDCLFRQGEWLPWHQPMTSW